MTPFNHHAAPESIEPQDVSFEEWWEDAILEDVEALVLKCKLPHELSNQPLKRISTENQNKLMAAWREMR